MVQPLSLLSEKYSPQGNVAAEGVLNQLGRPGLDSLSVLVRETVQNSWDARLADNETVHFTIAGRFLSATQLDFLRHMVLSEEPERLKLHDRLSSEAGNSVRILTISDRGTAGLNGPTRADALDDDTRSRNFVNFFFNVGQSKGNSLSGGTYGYGKSILYQVSQVSTICVYTRCLVKGRPESRFMAAALQPQKEKGSGYRLYTGRYWWGRKRSQADILEPLVGPDADEFARSLGLPLFTGDETGTCCMILLPGFGDSSFNEAMQNISRLLLWYCWPKMLTWSESKVSMQFAVYCDEQPVSILDPRDYPPLNGFVHAMKLLKNNASATPDTFGKVVSINQLKPKRLLGQLALKRFWKEERKESPSRESEVVVPISGVSHHVALMRNAELVVKYLDGDQLPISRFEYAGVFVVDPEVDTSFAKAEPPTHDDWVTKSMTEKEDKSIVNRALRKIQEELKVFVTPQSTGGRDEEVLPLGAFADRLGSMLIGVSGTAAYAEPVEERPWRRTDKRSLSGVDRYEESMTESPLFASPDHIVSESGDEQYAATIGIGSEDDSGSKDGIIKLDSSSSEKNRDGQHIVTVTTGSEKLNNGKNDATGTADRNGDGWHRPSMPDQNRDGQRTAPVTTGSTDKNGSGSVDLPTSEKIPSRNLWGQKIVDSGQETMLNGIKGQAKIELLDDRLSLFRDIPVMLTSFRVKHALRSRSTRVEVEASILLDNGEEESNPPADKTPPNVLFWFDSTGKERSGSDAVLIPAIDDGIWKVAVSLPDDALLRVNLLTREVF